jgi:hypothetical protein
MVGLVLCIGLTTAMDAVIMTEVPGNGSALLLMSLVGAAVGAAATGWRGPVLRRWFCVAAGAFLGQACGSPGDGCVHVPSGRPEA